MRSVMRQSTRTAQLSEGLRGLALLKAPMDLQQLVFIYGPSLAYASTFILAYILVGSTIFYQIEGKKTGLGYLDCIYWATITAHTVGYGDIAPKTTGGRLFTIVYILVGISVLVATVSMMLNIISDIQRERRISGQVPMPTPASVLRDAMRAVAVLLLLVGTGTLYFWSKDKAHLGLIDSVYLTVVTLSTVGYGDLIPVKDTGTKIFIIFYVFIGVAAFATQLGILTASVQRYYRAKEWTELMQRGVTEDLLQELESMDVDENGKIDRMEFTVFYLVNSGRVNRTELLQLQQLFDRLDRDGSGALDIDDLEKEVEHNDAVHAHP